jgi:DNA-binding transcriptional LysR family regulator
MRFDLVDLQLFIAVADCSSITRGARRVHLALASASARIKGLEVALGVILLKRDRRGIELTDVGIAVVPEAAARCCARSMPIMMIKIRDA